MKIPKNVSSGGCMRTPISPWPNIFVEGYCRSSWFCGMSVFIQRVCCFEGAAVAWWLMSWAFSSKFKSCWHPEESLGASGRVIWLKCCHFPHGHWAHWHLCNKGMWMLIGLKKGPIVCYFEYAIQCMPDVFAALQRLEAREYSPR